MFSMHQKFAQKTNTPTSLHSNMCIFMGQKNPKRNVAWSGWTDSDSGLETFSYKVYELTPDSDNQLTEKSSPVITGTQSAYVYVSRNYSYTCQTY